MSDLDERLVRFFAAGPRPAVEWRCARCGAVLLSIYHFDRRALLVAEGEDVLHAIERRSRVRSGPRVSGIREPMFYDADGLRWPLAVRCRRDNADAHAPRRDLDHDLDEHERAGKTIRRKIHLRPKSAT